MIAHRQVQPGEEGERVQGSVLWQAAEDISRFLKIKDEKGVNMYAWLTDQKVSPHVHQ